MPNKEEFFAKFGNAKNLCIPESIHFPKNVLAFDDNPAARISFQEFFFDFVKKIKFFLKRVFFWCRTHDPIISILPENSVFIGLIQFLVGIRDSFNLGMGFVVAIKPRRFFRIELVLTRL